MMTTNDSLTFIAAELHKQTKPIVNLKDTSDKALLGRTLKLANNQNLSLNGQATSSILTDIGGLSKLLQMNPIDPTEQELKKYLTTLSGISANDVLVTAQIAADAATQAAAAQKAAADAAKAAATDSSNANKQKAADAADAAAKAVAEAQKAQAKAKTTASKKK